MNLTLKRFSYTPDYCEGALYLNDAQLCWTIERPWRDNAPNISCIPDGDCYQWIPHVRPSGSKVWCVLGGTVCQYEHQITSDNHKTRYLILIHSANWAEQLGGCIAPGLKRKPGMVTKSRDAMRMLHEKLDPWFRNNRSIPFSIVNDTGAVL